MVASDWPLASGSFRRRHGAAADGSAPAMDATRFRLSLQLDAGHNPRAPEADHRGGAGRRGSRANERGVRPQPADPARRLRHGAADRVRQCGKPAAGSRRRAPRTNGSATGDGGQQAADYRAGFGGGDSAGGGRRHRGTHGGRSGGTSAAELWHFAARISFPSAWCRRRWSWHLRSASPC